MVYKLEIKYGIQYGQQYKYESGFECTYSAGKCVYDSESLSVTG